MSIFVRQQHTINAFEGSGSWAILSPIERSIKQKIEAVGTPLKEWNIQINYGIKTGCNEAFIISTEKLNEILANCKTDDERRKTADLIRPILRGRDIKRYGYNWANLYLIATFPSRHYNIDDYPSVKNYLLSYAKDYLLSNDLGWIVDKYLADFCKQKLSQTGKAVSIKDQNIIIGQKVEKARKKTSNKWFETQDSISYWEEFNKPKIIFQEIVQESQFFLDEEGTFMCNDTCRIITGEHLHFLLNIMNSSLFFYAVKHFYSGGKLGENGVRMKHTFFLNFPCLQYSSFIEKYSGIDQYNDLNNAIFKKYGLSSIEIKEIKDEQRYIEENLK